MSAKCDVCIEERCKGTENAYACDCDACEHADRCNKWIRPTIRITTKCTQACSHCCFTCSPKKSDHMSINTAQDVSKFITNNKHIKSVNVMGGEIFCNPDWAFILISILNIKSLKVIRVVSNSDWVADECAREFCTVLAQYKDKVVVSLSHDKWHTNKNVDAATKMLKEYGIPHNVDDGAMVDSAVVPIGRAELGYHGVYSMFGTYCGEDRKYQILISEDGSIHKCAFGIFEYDNVNNYLEGGFTKRFKEFHQAFDRCFISSCAACVRMGYKYASKNKNKEHV